ncbi:hypothetical protein GRS48_03675 [Halorubrum sp. JWXQ-INN 858]|uniref:alanyl-tRNA editing protein n=1 Tax=Halorubrum sp. JWXQ-INN 858 TaxID=2690782 RepID=UPI00135AB030|nr:DHHA1 domain-containing protein [Halorubrum sp. JWXQ-INN 858]MWV63925.1 hypothetical protein [Halorubrum sp. JWXQ-INN 858]
MTISRAPAEPDVREFEATVDRVDGRAVVLDETYFYAASGGQPADRGTLAGVVVDDVREREGAIHHVLADDPDIEPGETVVGVVDDAFRTYCARAHTASHVLYGAARRVCSGLGYAGFDISPEKVRVDLTADEPLDDADLVELERLSNRAVWDSRPVSWETMSAAAARALDDIAFNEKTEEGAMGEGNAVAEGGEDEESGGAGESGTGSEAEDADGAGTDGVRVVTVEGWDTAACGGTHVRNTAEIGPITALGRSNPGEGITRIEFAVGPTAIDRNAAVHAAALEASAAVDANVDGLVSAVERLRDRSDRLESELREATAALLADRLRALPTVERDGTTWAVGTVEGAEPNDLRSPAEALVGGDGPDGPDAPDAIAVVGAGGSPFVVVAAAPGADVDAGEVVAAITDEFGGGGGGGPTFAQGGGIGADAGTVVDWVRER